MNAMSRLHSVQAHMGLAAIDYDRMIRVLIPGYEQILSTIGWWLSKVLPEHGKLIELGGGTGALAEAVLTQLPYARLELWDVDAKMLSVASERLRRFQDRLTLREKSFMDKLEPCNGVITTLALHHISTLDAKRAVYANIFDALLPNGIFLNGDCTLDSVEPAHSVMLRCWLDFMAKHGITEEEGRNHFAEWAKEDSYLQLFDELTILDEAGFRRPEVYWRDGPFAVYGGIRS